MSQDPESTPTTEELAPHVNAVSPPRAGADVKPVPASSDPISEHNSERLSTTQVSESSATILENNRAPVAKAPLAAPPIPFDQLGSYEVLGELGRGGMGVVYKARHKDLDRLVALKILTIAGGASDDAVARFLTEGKIAAKLDDHDHIARVLDCGRIDGYSYLAMEFVRGTTFSELIKREKISIEEGVAVIIAVASALTYAHEKGVIHRDLKPENVLIDDSGKALLTDFGVAKILHESRATVTGAIMGTLHFMAPEQAEDASRIDARSDVYGLGAMLYNLLTGRPPHIGQSPASVLASLLTKEAPSPRTLNQTVSPALEKICLKALQRHPDDRYQSMAEMKTALEFCDGVAVESAPTKALEIAPTAPKDLTHGKDSPQPRRGPTPATPLVTGLVLFLILTVALLLIVFGTNKELPTQADPKPLAGKTNVSPESKGPVSLKVPDDPKFLRKGEDKKPTTTEKPGPSAQPERLLEDLVLWDRANPAQQDAAINRVKKELGAAFEFVRTKTFTTSCKGTGKPVITRRRVAVFRHKKLGIDFHLVPGGKTYIGTKNGKTELAYVRTFDPENWTRGDMATELPRVRVTFAPMLVARTELSQRAWDIIGGEDDRTFRDPSYPIESVMWVDIEPWLKKVGDGLRLPGEFEWEHAARAGTETRFYWGSEMDPNQCHFSENSDNRPLPVTNSSKGHNGFGLLHMTGNVREWCQDTYRSNYYVGPFTPTPYEEDEGGYRTQKGGGYDDLVPECRPSSRNGEYDDGVFPSVGIRLFRSIKTR